MSEMGLDSEERRSSRARRSTRDAGGSKRKLLVIGGVAVALVIAAAVAVATLGGDGGGSQAAVSARVLPRVYVNTPANSLVKKLNRRDQDKRPLNLNEVFGGQAKTVKHGTYIFTLAGSELVGDCKTVAWGTQLLADLAKHGCTQIARGAYVSQDARYTGQFIVVNLADLQGAEQVVRDLDPGSGAGFVSPLKGKGAGGFGGGFSAAYSQPFGHYVVISWVQRAGGAQPQTMNELLDASIAIERADDFVWERLVLAGE